MTGRAERVFFNEHTIIELHSRWNQRDPQVTVSSCQTESTFYRRSLRFRFETIFFFTFSDVTYVDDIQLSNAFISVVLQFNQTLRKSF